MGALVALLLMGVAIAGFAGLDFVDEETTEGGPGAEGFSGSDGDDRFSGGGGNDLLVGGNGDDSLSGDAGHDWVIGLDGHDELSGGNGDDVVIGGTGVDQINAGPGNDFVESANIVDEAALTASLEDIRSIADVVFQYDLPARSDEGDIIDLGPGNDTVVAGNNDVLTGGDGADEFALGDWIEGGQPVEITDFDTAEDIITFVYHNEGPTPELTMDRDERAGVTIIRSDGQAIAVVRSTSPDFSLSNIAVSRYAA